MKYDYYIIININNYINLIFKITKSLIKLY